MDIRSAETTTVLQTCAPGLVVPRLAHVAGVHGVVNGRGLHFAYWPALAPERQPHRYYAEEGRTAPFEVNLAPIWLPWAGQLDVLGGREGATFTLRLDLASCAARPAWGDPILTLRRISAAPVALPRGALAVRSPVAVATTFTFAGDAQAIVLPAGQWMDLGVMSFGTVQGPEWLDVRIGF